MHIRSEDSPLQDSSHTFKHTFTTRGNLESPAGLLTVCRKFGEGEESRRTQREHRGYM